MDRIDLGEDWWRRIQGPTEHARGLPNEAYGSEAVHRLEQRRLFARTWCFAGRASSVPAIGDVAPVEVAGLPLFMARGTDGEVRVFHNVCPHRGARLVPKCQRAKRSLVCPYHAWTYELDGRLKTVRTSTVPDATMRDRDAWTNRLRCSGCEVSDGLTGCSWTCRVRRRSSTSICAPSSRKFGEFPLDGLRLQPDAAMRVQGQLEAGRRELFRRVPRVQGAPGAGRMYGGPRTSPSIDGVSCSTTSTTPNRTPGVGGCPRSGVWMTSGGRCLFANLYPNLGMRFTRPTFSWWSSFHYRPGPQ